MYVQYTSYCNTSQDCNDYYLHMSFAQFTVFVLNHMPISGGVELGSGVGATVTNRGLRWVERGGHNGTYDMGQQDQTRQL